LFQSTRNIIQSYSLIRFLTMNLLMISLRVSRSVFTDVQLSEHWNYYPRNKPFIVNFLYLYSFPKRPNLKALIELGVIRDTSSVPRGFEEITKDQFELILGASDSDESFIIN